MIAYQKTRIARGLVLALLMTGTAQATAKTAEGETTLYQGARIWTGERFENRDLAVRGGRFVDPKTAGDRARTVQLKARWIVPAYANAHTHWTSPNEKSSRRFIDAGVFYAWNPNTNVIPREGKAFFARPDTFDVLISQGGITERGGHPEKLYKQIFPARTTESLVGDAFHYGETPAEIDAALDRLVVQGADFVKAYLLFSEDYAARRGKDVPWGRGLNPANIPHLMTGAKQRGLKVAFHTETMADLITAIENGATLIMHAPAYGLTFEEKTRDKWALTDEVAQRIAHSGAQIVTTYGLMHGFDGTIKGAEPARQRAVQAANLRLLIKHGATILIGTDTDGPIFGEAEHLASLGAFAPAELLGMVLGTGRHLFPERRIGCFDPGCEADFLVLRADPLADIKALRSIEKRIKGGNLIAASDTAPRARP